MSLPRGNNKTICIIGGGASGLTCIKCCIEEGLDIVCYERTSYLGGLWRYTDDVKDGQASVTRSTIINSNKEMSAYSDFPPPAEFPNFMHNTLMYRYFEMYAERFDLARHIKFEHQVLKIEPADDHTQTGRWKVKVKDNKRGQTSENVYDGVMLCIGHHKKPLIPTFPDQEKFNGQIMHTHSYKKPNAFEDKIVAVVGVGNSGGDAAVELSMVTKKTYLSTRSGCWILARVGPSGEPMDTKYLTRFANLFNQYIPFRLKCWFVESYLNSKFDHEKYGLHAKHRVFAQHPMVNDALPNRILSGTVTIKGNIEKFTENGVIFEGDKEETKLDAVLLATGYLATFEMFDDDVLWTEDNEVELFMYMFNPKLRHPHTLGVIGNIQAVGAAIPVSEQQARYYVQLMIGNRKLPEPRLMMKNLRDKRLAIEKQYSKGPRHTMQLDWIPFMDELASYYGAKPNLWRYFFTDPKLWYHLFFGAICPYQYRLVGPGAWKGARDALVTVQNRIDAPFKTRPHKKVESSLLPSVLWTILFFFISYVPWIFRSVLKGLVNIK